jgi:hypothetical protein
MEKGVLLLEYEYKAMTNGGQLLQCMKTGYHISLMFDGSGICQRVSHECGEDGTGSRVVEKQSFQIPSTRLGGEQNLGRLNTFKGKTRQEIIEIVGQPNSVIEIQGGGQLGQ